MAHLVITAFPRFLALSLGLILARSTPAHSRLIRLPQQAPRAFDVSRKFLVPGRLVQASRIARAIKLMAEETATQATPLAAICGACWSSTPPCNV